MPTKSAFPRRRRNPRQITKFEALARMFARAIKTAKTPAERRAAYDGLMYARTNDPAFQARMAHKRARFYEKHGFPP